MHTDESELLEFSDNMLLAERTERNNLPELSDAASRCDSVLLV